MSPRHTSQAMLFLLVKNQQEASDMQGKLHQTQLCMNEVCKDCVLDVTYSKHNKQPSVTKSILVNRKIILASRDTKFSCLVCVLQEHGDT